MSLSDIVRASRDRAAAAEAPRLALDPRGRRVLLVYLFGGLGDAALLAPVARALTLRGARVGLLLRPLGAATLARAGLRARRHALASDASRRDQVALRAELRAARYDVAVDLTHRGDVDARPWLIAEQRLGWLAPGESAREAGLDAGADDIRTQADRHWSRACVPPLAPLGIDAPAYDVPWRAPAAARAWAEARWGRGPRVLLVPGSRSADKRYEGWGEVARALVEQRGARVVVSGAPWEADSMRALAAPLGDAAQLYTGRDLGRLLALVQAAHLVLTNDTGPMHWAFACERPTVALFLHMAPESWGPPRPDARFWVRRVAPGLPDAASARAVVDAALARLT